MEIISSIQHLTFLGLFFHRGSDAIENFLKIKLWNDHMLRANFELIPETGVVPRPLPGWMQFRPLVTTNMEVFINDHSERYYIATIDGRDMGDEAQHRNDPEATPQRASIRFTIQNWVAFRFNLHTRPNSISSSDTSRSFSPPTIDTIYVMVMNGDIYSSEMKYRSTEQNAGPGIGRPIESGPLRGAPVVNGHLLGGEAVGIPVIDGTVVGTTHFPDVPLDHVYTLISNGVIQQGRLEEKPRTTIPLWMQSWPTNLGDWKAFIRQESGRHFEVSFSRRIIPPQTPYPHSSMSMPRYAEIHFPNERLVANDFQWYEPPYNKPRSFWKFNNFPSANKIYILLPSGYVCASKIKNWQPVIHQTV